MSKLDQATTLLSSWWAGLKPVPQNNNLPAKGTIATALVILERLKDDYSLEINDHRTEGGAQIAGTGKTAVQRILARHGENREFLREGGRTSRGAPGENERLLDALGELALEADTLDERNAFLEELQRQLVLKISEYFNRERIKVPFDPQLTAWEFINQLLSIAQQEAKDGPVAEYLVGAKLALRFPDHQIRNHISSSQDRASGEPGDFKVGDTVFHVTIAPNQSHFNKCRQNLTDGYNVYLLVSNRVLEGTKQIAGGVAQGKITVQSIESFVSQNIDELSEFDKNKTARALKQLLDTYNQRVDQVEIDKSLLVEAPRNLG